MLRDQHTIDNRTADSSIPWLHFQLRPSISSSEVHFFEVEAPMNEVEKKENFAGFTGVEASIETGC